MPRKNTRMLASLSEETRRALGAATMVCAIAFLVWAMLDFGRITGIAGTSVEAAWAALVFVGIAASAAYLGRAVFEGEGRHASAAAGIFLLSLGTGIGGSVVRAAFHGWPAGPEHALYIATAAVLFSAGTEFLGVRRGLTAPLVIAGLLVFAMGYYQYNIGEKTYDVWLEQGVSASIVNGRGMVVANAVSDGRGLAKLSAAPARVANATLVVEGKSKA